MPIVRRVNARRTISRPYSAGYRRARSTASAPYRRAFRAPVRRARYVRRAYPIRRRRY